MGLGNEFDFWIPTAVEKLLFGSDTLGWSLGEWKVVQVSCGLNHTAAVVEVT